jgi:hypothetical protein
VTDKEIALIERIVGALGSSADVAISAYTRWFVVASVVWVLIALALFYAAKRLWAVKTADSHDQWMPRAGAGVCVAAGLLMIGCNVADLVAPEAKAIHQLLNDIVP